MTDGNDLLVAYLKAKPIHCEMIQEVQNNDLIMVRLKNYIDSWIILRIEDKLDFDLWRSWKFRWIVSESMIMIINCKGNDEIVRHKGWYEITYEVLKYLWLLMVVNFLMDYGLNFYLWLIEIMCKWVIQVSRCSLFLWQSLSRW